jgi:AmmeMemoRadiSam system protein B
VSPTSPQGRSIGPTVAGSWYPAEPSALAEEVDRLVRSVSDDLVPDPRPVAGLIAPHAGYVYSGAVAARGFRILGRSGATRVVVLGPSHYVGFRGAVVPDAESYRTPLGAVPLDVGALRDLASRPGVALDTRPFEREHSLDAEIPFLQRVLDPGFRLVPVLVGSSGDRSDARRVAEALEPLLVAGTVIVVSSDFTHFGPRFGYVPFRRNVEDGIRELDHAAIRAIESGDPEAFEAFLAETDATICGRHPIDAALCLLRGRAAASLVAYDTSGRQTGDWGHSVSYASIAFRSGP